MSLALIPVTFREACAFIRTHHRHHRPPRGMKFAIGVTDGDALVGVATVGRPVARHLDDGRTAEVTRTCTVGKRNANSMLYAAAWRAARAMGYQRLITYTHAGESGASLRAAGFVATRTLRPRRGWHTPSRPRTTHGVDSTQRTRWEICSAPSRSCESAATSGTAGMKSALTSCFIPEERLSELTDPEAAR